MPEACGMLLATVDLYSIQLLIVGSNPTGARRRRVVIK